MHWSNALEGGCFRLLVPVVPEFSVNSFNRATQQRSLMSALTPVVPSDLEDGAPARRPARDCFLGFCRLLNCLTAVSALLCGVAHSMALATGPPLFNYEGSRVQILRMYGVGLSLLLMLVETEYAWLMDLMRVMENWLSRAIVQGLLVMMTLELATSAGSSDFDLSLRLYRQIAGLCMLGCAGVYAIGGLLCFAALRRARYQRQSERLRVERDLEDLERQRAELQGLLAGYTK